MVPACPSASLSSRLLKSKEIIRHTTARQVCNRISLHNQAPTISSPSLFHGGLSLAGRQVKGFHGCWVAYGAGQCPPAANMLTALHGALQVAMRALEASRTRKRKAEGAQMISVPNLRQAVLPTFQPAGLPAPMPSSSAPHQPSFPLSSAGTIRTFQPLQWTGAGPSYFSSSSLSSTTMASGQSTWFPAMTGAGAPSQTGGGAPQQAPQTLPAVRKEDGNISRGVEKPKRAGSNGETILVSLRSPFVQAN